MAEPYSHSRRVPALPHTQDTHRRDLLSLIHTDPVAGGSRYDAGPSHIPAAPFPLGPPAYSPCYLHSWSHPNPRCPAPIPDPLLPGTRGPEPPSPRAEGHVALSSRARHATTAGRAGFGWKRELLRGGASLGLFFFLSVFLPVSGSCRSSFLAGGGWAQS